MLLNLLQGDFFWYTELDLYDTLILHNYCEALSTLSGENYLPKYQAEEII